MKKTTLFLALAFLFASTLFAQTPPPPPAVEAAPAALSQDAAPGADAVTAVPEQKKIRLFAPGQYDSVLALVPGGDSLRVAGQIVGMGADAQTGDIMIISLDPEGSPVKHVCPASALKLPPAGKTRLAQDGRTWFILETTAKSAYVYPSSYASIFSDSSGENGQVVMGAGLLTVGGMLYGTYAFTKNMELGYGRVALMNYGATMLGGYYPNLISALLRHSTPIDDKYLRHDTIGISEIFEEYRSPTATDLVRAWSSVFGFPLGIFLGSRLNIIDKDDYGKATVMEYFSQTAGALAFALPVFYYDHPDGRDKRGYLTAGCGLSMAFLPAGFYGGYKFVENRDISAGRGTLLWVTGAMGSLTGLGLAALGDEYHGIASTRAVLASTIAGYAGGTALGFVYKPRTDYTFWQSVFIGASSAAGSGMVVAFPLIAQTEKHQPYILAALAGGWTGFFIGDRLSLSLFEKSSRDLRSSQFRIELPGIMTLPAALGCRKSARAETRGPAIPVAAAEWRF